MTVIDVEEYLEPVSDESPAGDNFEDDLAFLELEQAARGKEERRVGAIVVPAEPPDWKAVLRASINALIELNDRTRVVRSLLMTPIVASELRDASRCATC